MKQFMLSSLKKKETDLKFYEDLIQTPRFGMGNSIKLSIIVPIMIYLAVHLGKSEFKLNPNKNKD